MGILDTVLDQTAKARTRQQRVVHEEHDLTKINWVEGLADPGEMIKCGYLPEIRRRDGEQDREYAERIRPIVMALPKKERELIMGSAIKRAGYTKSNGKVCAAFAGDVPWAGLGTVVSEAMTAEEAMTFSHTGWKVRKEPVRYYHNGELRTDESKWVIVREDTGAALGNVGRQYNPFQNEDAFGYLDAVLAQFKARYEVAMALSGGKLVVLLVRMPQHAFKINGDRMAPYIAFSNVHDGTAKAWTYPTVEREVCRNTHTTSFNRNHKRGLGIRHSGDLKSRVAQTQQALGIAVDEFAQYRQVGEVMAKTRCNIKAFANDVLDASIKTTIAARQWVSAADAAKGADALAAALHTTQAKRDLEAKSFQRKIDNRENVLEQILAIYEADNAGGSVWGGFNAFTNYADHSQQKREVGTTEERAGRRFLSSLAGDADALKQVAYQQAMALVQAN